MIVVILILFIILICSLLFIYYNNFYSFDKKLQSYPCPPEVPILGHTLEFFSGKGFLDVLMDYTRHYGDIVRIKTGPKRQLLLISNYEFFEFVLSSVKIVKKSVDYRHFHRWFGNSMVTSEGSEWKKRRRLITPTFSYNVLENFLPIFESNTVVLLKHLEKHVDETSVDIHKFINLCALHIICESAMGTSVNAQENSESEYVESVKTMLDIIIERIFSPYKMFDCIYYCTKDYQREKTALKVLHSYTWDVLRSRLKTREQEDEYPPEQKKKAFLDLLLDVNDNGERLTLEQIREEVDTFMFAGHDTTGYAISFILFCLANHPEEQTRVFLEQKEIFGDDFDRPVTLRDLSNMKYLDLVIKEGLRLYPSVPFISRELESDVEFKGTILPKGLTLTFFIYALHRNPQYFPDPEKFLPSRFKTFDGKMPFAYVPFSAGPRNCIGQKFANAEIKTVVSKVIKNFELLPSIPFHELKIASHTVLHSTNGVCLRFKKRKQE